jgi:hypothetical protein
MHWANFRVAWNEPIRVAPAEGIDRSANSHYLHFIQSCEVWTGFVPIIFASTLPGCERRFERDCPCADLETPNSVAEPRSMPPTRRSSFTLVARGDNRQRSQSSHAEARLGPEAGSLPQHHFRQRFPGVSAANTEATPTDSWGLSLVKVGCKGGLSGSLPRVREHPPLSARGKNQGQTHAMGCSRPREHPVHMARK